MALLHILNNVKNVFDPILKLEVVNFNHKLRSQSDEEVITFYY
jgi:tRNA(Ile)-lysidine synthase TilS/MesJ